VGIRYKYSYYRDNKYCFHKRLHGQENYKLAGSFVKTSATSTNTFVQGNQWMPTHKQDLPVSATTQTTLDE
jgi:hypothetical protein